MGLRHQSASWGRLQYGLCLSIIIHFLTVSNASIISNPLKTTNGTLSTSPYSTGSLSLPLNVSVNPNELSGIDENGLEPFRCFDREDFPEDPFMDFVDCKAILRLMMHTLHPPPLDEVRLFQRINETTALKPNAFPVPAPFSYQTCVVRLDVLKPAPGEAWFEMNKVISNVLQVFSRCTKAPVKNFLGGRSFIGGTGFFVLVKANTDYSLNPGSWNHTESR